MMLALGHVSCCAVTFDNLSRIAFWHLGGRQFGRLCQQRLVTLRELSPRSDIECTTGSRHHGRLTWGCGSSSDAAGLLLRGSESLEFVGSLLRVLFHLIKNAENILQRTFGVGEVCVCCLQCTGRLFAWVFLIKAEEFADHSGGKVFASLKDLLSKTIEKIS